MIDFEKVLGRKLPKGYDFKDFCNQIADATTIKEKLIKGRKDEFKY